MCISLEKKRRGSSLYRTTIVLQPTVGKIMNAGHAGHPSIREPACTSTMGDSKSLQGISVTVNGEAPRRSVG